MNGQMDSELIPRWPRLVNQLPLPPFSPLSPSISFSPFPCAATRTMPGDYLGSWPPFKRCFSLTTGDDCERQNWGASPPFPKGPWSYPEQHFSSRVTLLELVHDTTQHWNWVQTGVGRVRASSCPFLVLMVSGTTTVMNPFPGRHGRSAGDSDMVFL